MWQLKILAITWLCVLWTKVDSAPSSSSSSEDAAMVTTPRYLAESSTISVRAAAADHRMIDHQDLDATKTYSADSTVRSFFPVRGKQKWMRRGYPPADEMLFFNVTVVNDNEEVSLAELHLHRRRIAKIHGTYRKRFLPLPYRVVLYQVQPDYRRKVDRDARTMKLASLPVSHATKSGWHTLDVTAVLRELLINAQGPVELLLGVQFEAPRGLAKSLVPLKHFLKPTDRPYKASSYLVVFTEIDPYFEEFEDGDSVSYTTSDETENEIPDGHVFRERHLKHKIFKVKSNDVIDEDDDNDSVDDVDDTAIDGDEEDRRIQMKKKKKNSMMVKKKELKSMKMKYKGMENEVYDKASAAATVEDSGRRREDVVRHKSKHRMSDVKRSKADELALQQKNKLKSMPFLHTNEVEEIRQTSRRLTRSVDGSWRRHGAGGSTGNEVPGTSGGQLKAKDIRRILNRIIQDESRTSGTNGTCNGALLSFTVDSADLGVRLPSRLTFATAPCAGLCSSAHVGRTCRPGSRKPLDFEHYDAMGHLTSVRLDNFLVADCECR